MLILIILGANFTNIRCTFRTEKVNNLMRVMENPMVFGMYDQEEQLEMKRELKRLISI